MHESAISRRFYHICDLHGSIYDLQFMIQATDDGTTT